MITARNMPPTIIHKINGYEGTYYSRAKQKLVEPSVELLDKRKN